MGAPPVDRPSTAPVAAEIPIARRQFLRRYVSAMRSGDAALFLGAGMSRPSGFVDWKGLLRDCADMLQLDLDREHDLVAVAQYYLNHKGGERGDLNSILHNEFKGSREPTENHRVIARLPIRRVWTTNYDTLLEQAYVDARRTIDIKRRDQDIPLLCHGREVVIYKMHGDVTNPTDIVIAKDDYERYPVKHRLFQNALESDLLSSTFLFLGLSFTDPNLEYVLAHIRTLLEHQKREHYAIMRQARLSWTGVPESARAELAYDERRQALKARDLQRYGIETLLVESFGEITTLLQAIEQAYKQRCVFVSGSAHDFSAFSEDRLHDLCMQLGQRLVGEHCQLISGMGLHVGDSVVNGALVQLYESKLAATDEHLFLRPFPRQLPPGHDPDDFNRRYRYDLITKCGVAVFIAGTSRTSPVSKGVMEEYEIAKRLQKVIIPIGATGFAAEHIWRLMQPDVRKAYGGAVSDEVFARLNDPNLPDEEILDAVFTIIRLTSQL